MGDRRLEILQRRQILLAKIATQREQMKELAGQWNMPIRFFDQAGTVLNFVRVHTVLLAGIAGLAVLRRNSLSGLVRGGWRMWRAWRYFNDTARKFSSGK
jgi:hypothetical protein